MFFAFYPSPDSNEFLVLYMSYDSYDIPAELSQGINDPTKHLENQMSSRPDGIPFFLLWEYAPGLVELLTYILETTYTIFMKID